MFKARPYTEFFLFSSTECRQQRLVVNRSANWYIDHTCRFGRVVFWCWRSRWVWLIVNQAHKLIIVDCSVFWRCRLQQSLKVKVMICRLSTVLRLVYHYQRAFWRIWQRAKWWNSADCHCWRCLHIVVCVIVHQSPRIAEKLIKVKFSWKERAFFRRLSWTIAISVSHDAAFVSMGNALATVTSSCWLSSANDRTSDNTESGTPELWSCAVSFSVA